MTKLTVNLPLAELDIDDCGDTVTVDVIACLRGRVHAASVADGDVCGEMATRLTVSPTPHSRDPTGIYTHSLRRPMMWIVPVSDTDLATRARNSTTRTVTLNEQVLCLLVRLPRPRTAEPLSHVIPQGDRERVAEERRQHLVSRAAQELESLAQRVGVTLANTSYDMASDHRLSHGGFRQAAMALVESLGEMTRATSGSCEDPLPEDFRRAAAHAIAALMAMLSGSPTVGILPMLQDAASEARRDPDLESCTPNQMYGRIVQACAGIVGRIMCDPITSIHSDICRNMALDAIGMLVILATELGGATP